MSAILSPCGLYRYRLERDVGMEGSVFAFFGINPSTADATVDDATVRKWTGFVKRWGGRRFIVGNVWPLRSTDVRALATATRWLDIGRENQHHILQMAAEADVLVPCWGDRAKVPRAMHNELDELLSLLRGTGKPVKHFGLTKGGDPKHPLMLGYDTPLVPYGVTPSAPAGKAPEDSYPDQTVLHAEGQCGNCLQATIAGVLGWPLAAVPHFALLGEDHWWDCMQAWLDSQGYWIDYQPTSYAAQGGELLPRCWLSGRSPRGFGHAVIGDTATLQMLHDPHPTRAGLVSVDYTIYFFRKPTPGVLGTSDDQGEKR